LSLITGFLIIFLFIEFEGNNDSIIEMSLLWRKKCGEPCENCKKSSGTDLCCDYCDKVWSIVLLSGKLISRDLLRPTADRV